MKLLRQIGSWALLAAFLASFAAREGHRLFAHAHEEKLACAARPGESHIHSAEFEAHACELCAFFFATAQLPDFQWPAIAAPVFFEKKVVAFDLLFSDRRGNDAPGRGPPVG